MLVIAPIVILAIGAFLTVIIGMTGEVIASRASNALTYNVQDALNRIEQDVKLSSSFISSTSNFALSNNQGYNDDTTNFTNVSATNGSAIILNMIATTTNPINANSAYILLNNKPNPCASSTGNAPFTYSVVYFIKNSTLWRRTIMPSNYTDTTNTVCTLPWQQPSCSPTFMSAQTGAVFCKTNDIRLVDGVSPTSFFVQYFSGEGASTINTPASSTAATDTARNTALQSATTVAVSISATQTAGGRDVSRSAILRVSRLDTNASSIGVTTTDGVPNAPNIIASQTEPTNVAFKWDTVTGATGYTMEYRLNGGAWTTAFTNQSTKTYTVTTATHKDVVDGRVTAINAAGSTQSIKTYTIPLWTPLALQNSWIDYSPPYASASYTKTSAGLIVLKGLVKNGSGTIGILPAGYRPSNGVMFENSTNSAGGRVDVTASGSIIMSVGNNAWFSLDGIAFMPASATFTAATLQNGWLNYSPGSGDPNWQNAGYLTDSAGRVQITGLIQSGTTTSGTAMFTLPVASRPSEYLHIVNDSANTPTIFSVNSTGTVEVKGSTANTFVSLQEMFYPTGRTTGTTCTTQWCALALINGWQYYGAPFGTPQYTKSSDGVVMLKGLINTVGSPTLIVATLPVGYCPSGQFLGSTASNAVWARLDIVRQADGTCTINPSTGASNVWLSLDDVRYMAEP